MQEGGAGTYTPLEYVTWWKIGSNLMFQSGKYKSSRKKQGTINQIVPKTFTKDMEYPLHIDS